VHHVLEIRTTGPGLYEITSDVATWVHGQGDGLLTLLVQHTSASLLIQENADPEVQTDLHAYFDRLVPPATDPSMSYLRHTYEGPDDMPAHIKAALMPVSLSIRWRKAQCGLETGKAFIWPSTAPARTCAASRCIFRWTGSCCT